MIICWGSLRGIRASHGAEERETIIKKIEQNPFSKCGCRADLFGYGVIIMAERRENNQPC